MLGFYTLNGTLESDYPNAGSWQGVFDTVTAIALFGNLHLTADRAEMIRLRSRSSYDGTHWSAEYSDGLSPHGRYVEITLLLEADGTIAPTISEMALDWHPAVIGESNAKLAMAPHNVRLEVAK